MTAHPLSQLAEFAASTDVAHLPRDVVEKAKACVLYAGAVAVASMRARQPGQAAAAVGDSSASPATRLYDGITCAPRAAAFANGTLFHARVQDDAHPAGHVGVVVIPAALAMAEAKGISGTELLAAVVAGYETALRIGRDHTADLSGRGFRTTPAYGVFGAAAAVARVLRLDATRTTHALALAANMAGGLREFAEAGSEDFAFQAGSAAMNGILAAELAAGGATGATSALEGAGGFFRAFGEKNRDYAARISEGLGRDFEIMAVTYKPYPICQFHRGIVRGCLALRASVAGELPGSLEIHMHPFEADFFGVRFKGPFISFPQTFMSAPFCAALAWMRGAVTLAGLNDFSAEDIIGMVRRVEVVSDPQRQRYSPLIEARMSSGQPRTWDEREGEGAYALGWGNACLIAQVLCAEVNATEYAEPLIDIAGDLQAAANMDPLMRALRNACAASRGAR